jgi:hypothetical protein
MKSLKSWQINQSLESTRPKFSQFGLGDDEEDSYDDSSDDSYDDSYDDSSEDASDESSTEEDTTDYSEASDDTSSFDWSDAVSLLSTGVKAAQTGYSFFSPKGSSAAITRPSSPSLFPSGQALTFKTAKSTATASQGFTSQTKILIFAGLAGLILWAKFRK